MIGFPLSIVGAVVFVVLRRIFGFERAGLLDELVANALVFSSMLPVLYVMARLSLSQPAAALLQPMSLGDSWRATRGMGWRLTAVLLAAPAALTLILPFLVLGESVQFLAFYVLSYILSVSGTVFTIAVLSLAYGWFISQGLTTGAGAVD